MVEDASENSEFDDTPVDIKREIEKLLTHRLVSDDEVEILVQWSYEPDNASFEPEVEIQQCAPKVLYEYWMAQGGRTEALYQKDRDAPLAVYHAFKILRHERRKGAFQFEVQWVGYPATTGNTSLEPEDKLRDICPELLEEYWKSQGGRDKCFAKCGRGKKP
ncbi:heterochromatin protein [Apiospora marii]|uniref:heterochromatin protein n=1 Tax=Apiospora marii TaxID=335849 RepID=UPI00312FF0B6